MTCLHATHTPHPHHRPQVADLVNPDLPTTTFYPFEVEPKPDACWDLHTGPDGRVYAAACCEHRPGGVAHLMRYNDETDRMEALFNIAEAVGQPASNGHATQCKLHYSMTPCQSDGMLYAATHLSAPAISQQTYRAWGDWKDPVVGFPCSYLLAYDTVRDKLAWTSPFIPWEGSRCMCLDEKRRRLYSISYPRDHFWIYDLDKRTIRSLGRLGSVNSQAIFSDKFGRIYTSNDRGQLVRYDPDTDKLTELPVYLPHSVTTTRWHQVLYDVVASPAGDCVYGVPWGTNPHLFRYWLYEGDHGRMEDLGAVHQPRDPRVALGFAYDHCGGLVFGADGQLYLGTMRWTLGSESRPSAAGRVPTIGVIQRMDPKTLERTDVARFARENGHVNYASRAARDRYGNLFFGNLAYPLPVGLSRLVMNATGDHLHLPLRVWG